jgi:hypothetical protein
MSVRYCEHDYPVNSSCPSCERDSLQKQLITMTSNFDKVRMELDRRITKRKRIFAGNTDFCEEIRFKELQDFKEWLEKEFGYINTQKSDKL